MLNTFAPEGSPRIPLFSRILSRILVTLSVSNSKNKDHEAVTRTAQEDFMFRSEFPYAPVPLLEDCAVLAEIVLPQIPERGPSLSNFEKGTRITEGVVCAITGIASTFLGVEGLFKIVGVALRIPAWLCGSAILSGIFIFQIGASLIKEGINPPENQDPP